MFLMVAMRFLRSDRFTLLGFITFSLALTAALLAIDFSSLAMTASFVAVSLFLGDNNPGSPNHWLLLGEKLLSGIFRQDLPLPRSPKIHTLRKYAPLLLPLLNLGLVGISLCVKGIPDG
jgi:hypothetical protein